MMRRQQQGAALVVGLMLLVILTLLAISGMSTATTELVMAGNEQFQARAFQAAETGIERVIATGTFNPMNTTQAAASLAVADKPTTQDDRFAATTRPRGTTLPPPGFSLDAFTSEHFEIVSQGTSARNATSTHTQGLFLLAPSSK
jgi:type IV pilus assembly protein PilX